MSPRIQLSPQYKIINPLSGQQQKVSANEYRLLRAIPREGLEKERLVDLVWGGRGRAVGDSSYYNLIYRLRRNLAAIGVADGVVTIPGFGVLLRCEVELVLSQPLVCNAPQ
ncbi:transcriptional regulator [Vogesella sp. GCM10023246]|uniref:OmpR/PhoB-type domain-containing protein n=1 Tax=Vogesella oryzagri TaxID=3160864 RepID=A0ABV1LZ70_9NEIS